ncbi:hypothetical protein QJS10_CPA05g00285 [Acorus calamus]|uniref:Uncharacterized protein n=1 Tax=Acorus calamus TaxID=4465 RepID=A0AAV9EY54_ACOCL|nr:hypothetical protein QJS10_CPA05g00285 [Acorus calamus]
MADYDWSGYGSGYGGYSVGGDRKLEIVSGKAYSAAASYGGGGYPTGRFSDPPLPLPPIRPPKSKAAATTSSIRSWSLSDPEIKRRRRVAGYKSYSVEGKVKASLRKSFRWIKIRCSELVHGW